MAYFTSPSEHYPLPAHTVTRLMFVAGSSSSKNTIDCECRYQLFLVCGLSWFVLVVLSGFLWLSAK
jgi:hypothetical protein